MNVPYSTQIVPLAALYVELGDDLNSAIAISVINKTPIDAHTNRIISGRAPSAYLARLREQMPADILEKVLGAHWIDAGALEADDFATTFIQRGQRCWTSSGEPWGAIAVPAVPNLKQP